MVIQEEYLRVAQRFVNKTVMMHGFGRNAEVHTVEVSPGHRSRLCGVETWKYYVLSWRGNGKLPMGYKPVIDGGAGLSPLKKIL